MFFADATTLPLQYQLHPQRRGGEHGVASQFLGCFKRCTLVGGEPGCPEPLISLGQVGSLEECQYKAESSGNYTLFGIAQGTECWVGINYELVVQRGSSETCMKCWGSSKCGSIESIALYQNVNGKCGEDLALLKSACPVHPVASQPY